MFKLFISISLLQLFLFASTDQFAKKMNYFTNYNEALKESKKQNLPIMLVVGTNTCPWCKKLENQTLKKPIIDKYVKKNFIPLKLHKDKDIYPKKRFETKVVPTIFFIGTKNEKLIYKVRGYKNKKEFLSDLEKAKSLYNLRR